MIAHEFVFEKDKAGVADFIQILPNGKINSILSSPQFVEERNMFKVLKSFESKVWILIILSYYQYKIYRNAFIYIVG